MGSEDADLEELGNIYLGGEKLVWDTKQTGAVGRMKPKGLEKLLFRIEGELSVQPFGKELVGLLKEAYLESPDIQTATFRLIHKLFAEYGLVVLIPDRASLKKLMIPVFEDDLFEQTPSKLVDETIGELSQHYKVQANPRPINLFYLKDDLRGRIERVGDGFKVYDSTLVFSEKEIREELHHNPERFSPNVILRGLFQETILPNIAFIGGGGELAYWLQLKELFNHYKVAYPVLLLRNSFLLIEEKWQEKIGKLNFDSADFFLPEQELLNKLVARESKHDIKLNGSLVQVEELYNAFKKQASEIDETLAPHVDSLKARSLQRLQELEKKMLRAEKRKFADHQRQIQVIKAKLFPNNSLQERIDNFSYYYAKWGSGLINKLYEHSLTLQGEFVVLEEK